MALARRLSSKSQILLRAGARDYCIRLPSALNSQHSSKASALLPSSNYFARRHTGTKIRKSLEELPQGLQQPLEPWVEKEAFKYSPVIDEVLQNQRRFPNCVLLTRLGKFYEVSPSIVSTPLTSSSCTSSRQKRLRRYLTSS